MMTATSTDLIVQAIRAARAKIERVRAIPDAIREEEGRQLVALLDQAEQYRHAELAAAEAMAVPVARRPRTAW